MVSSPDFHSGERRFDPGTVYLEPIKIEKLDFSQFHALDHLPGSPYCWTQYGGLRTHLKYGWELKWRGWLLCPFGWHDWADSRSSTGWSGKACWFCLKHKET